MKVMAGFFHVLCVVVVVCFLLGQPGCTGSKEEGSQPADPKTEGVHQAKVGGFTVPEEGTPGERVRKLWGSTGPVMKVDAQANLSDKEYQEKRTPLFSVWVTLQGKLSLAAQKDEKTERVIPEVLKFIDNLYGFPGFTEDRRGKDRATAKKYFDSRYEKLDEEIRKLN